MTKPLKADVVVLDGTNLVHRCYHAMRNSDIRDSSGAPVWALVGLVNYITKTMARLGPSKLIVAFDTIGGCPTRKALAPEYKAGRSTPDEDLVVQLDVAPKLLESCGFSVSCVDGWEADDICATVTVKAAARGFTSAVLSSDKDAHQLISDSCFVLKPEGKVLDGEALGLKYGFDDGSRWPEYAALIGEDADNLKGVEGIGPKRAVQLINHFESIEHAFDDLAGVEDLAGRTVAKALARTGARETFCRNVQVGLLKADLELGVTGRLPSFSQAVEALEKAGIAGPSTGLSRVLSGA